MIKNTFLLIVLLCCNTFLFGQKFVPFQTLTVPKAQYFTSDQLGQFYIVTEQNELIKYGFDGKEQYRYANKKLGKLTLVDATNPFNILLYYRDFQIIITLDRTLTLSGTYSLFDLFVTNPTAVCISDVSDIWLYDAGNSKIQKFSRQTGFLRETETLIMDFGKRELMPNLMVARHAIVFLNAPDKGIFMFDQFGKFIKKLNIINPTHIQIWDEGQLIYRDKEKGELFKYYLQNGATVPIRFPVEVKTNDQIRLERKRFFILRSGEVLLEVFDIQS